MDPHVEGKPPSATVAEVDVEVEREVSLVTSSFSSD